MIVCLGLTTTCVMLFAYEKRSVSDMRAENVRLRDSVRRNLGAGRYEWCSPSLPPGKLEKYAWSSDQALAFGDSMEWRKPSPLYALRCAGSGRLVYLRCLHLKWTAVNFDANGLWYHVSTDALGSHRVCRSERFLVSPPADDDGRSAEAVNASRRNNGSESDLPGGARAGNENSSSTHDSSDGDRFTGAEPTTRTDWRTDDYAAYVGYTHTVSTECPRCVGEPRGEEGRPPTKSAPFDKKAICERKSVARDNSTLPLEEESDAKYFNGIYEFGDQVWLCNGNSRWILLTDAAGDDSD